MTLLGTIVLDIVGLILVLWLLNLVRLGRLYVGYGIVLLFAIVASLGIKMGHEIAVAESLQGVLAATDDGPKLLIDLGPRV